MASRSPKTNNFQQAYKCFKCLCFAADPVVGLSLGGAVGVLVLLALVCAAVYGVRRKSGPFSNSNSASPPPPADVSTLTPV